MKRLSLIAALAAALVLLGSALLGQYFGYQGDGGNDAELILIGLLIAAWIALALIARTHVKSLLQQGKGQK